MQAIFERNPEQREMREDRSGEQRPFSPTSLASLSREKEATMPNGLALPTGVNDIDTELQSLEFMKQSLESLQALRGSLGEASTILDQVKTDLKGDTLSVKDFVDLGLDAEGNFTVSLNTDKIDLTELPADLVAQAVETQTALQEVLSPFVKSQSALLRSLEKIQFGLTEGSKKFGEVADAIKRVQ